MNPRQHSILVGAVVTAILSTSYFAFLNVVCCLGVVIGGAVTTHQYVRRTEGPIQAGDGAVLGAIAGAGGSILSSILDQALRPLDLDMKSILEPFQKQMMQNAQSGQGMSPEMMQQLQGDGGEMFTMLGIMMMVINVIVFAVFGALGGAIGSAIFGEEKEV